MELTRRMFLAHLGVAGGGLALGLFQGARAATYSPVTAGEFKPSVFIHVRPDGSTTLVCHRSEMGQGVRSTIPALLADELGADPARVTIAQADGDPAYGDQNTDGSSSIRTFYEELRRTGAAARTLLIAAAAQRWKIAPARCEAHGHAVWERGGGRHLGFGELASEAAKLEVPGPRAVALRPDSELTHVFRTLPLVDALAIATGKAQFGADLRVPGMLIAVIARPPVVGGRIARYDASKALAVPGVRKVIEMPVAEPPWKFQPWGGVAVLAADTWSALRGRAALEISWEAGAHGGVDTGTYRQQLSASAAAPGTVVRNVGDVEAALGKAARVVDAEYHVPHLPHTPMEPPVALAAVRDDACEIWTPTQDPQTARKEAAALLGVPVEKVTVHVTLLGGGFGRKSKADFVAEAVYLSQRAGVPVRVQWTREDDLQHDYYNATSTQRLTAGLDDHGRVVAWRHRTAFPPIASLFREASVAGADELQQGVTDLPLAIPNVRAEACEAVAHVRVGWLRSVYNIFHAFSVGSFIDELAHARGRDPRDTLLELLGPPRKLSLEELGVGKLRNYGASLERHPVDAGRLRGVVERVTQAAGWTAQRSAGRALGLAAHRSFLTCVAAVVSVERRADGRPHVDEVWLAVDAGTVVNPDRARAQMEGAVIFGMSLALYGGVTLKNGAVQETNFRDHRLVRLPEAPRRIHVELVQSEAPPGGIGEPGVPPIAPALANALFALTGKRMRALPFSAAGVV